MTKLGGSTTSGRGSASEGTAQPYPCRVAEIECKTALVRSGLADYALNCYRGCEHGCVYCYARFAARFSHPGEEWGSFVDIRVNAAEVLAREVGRKKRGRVFLSSVCDGWQPLEEDYQLSRACLESLVRNDFPVTVLTKSRLICRDLDLLAAGQAIELGVTVTTLDEDLRRVVEPHSSPSLERIAVLEEAKGKDITTYAFVGPLMPYLSDGEEQIGPLFRLLREVQVDYLYLDRLNPRWGVWPSLRRVLAKRFPLILSRYREILHNPAVREVYSDRLRATALRLARQHSLEQVLRFCF